MADLKDRLTWNDEDSYWRSNWRSRPYASGGSYDYDYYQPGYRYGFESAGRFADREWDDVESDLQSGWDRVRVPRRLDLGPGEGRGA